MFLIDRIILLAGVLLLIGILSSKFFLVVGMEAGEEGIGGIAFDNFDVAHAIGKTSEALIPNSACSAPGERGADLRSS